MSELGQALKEAREEKGLTLDDIQDLTKIQKRYLMAIETGEYDKLPGNFYTRAFMKSYAEAVGLDPRELFAEYSKDLPQLESEVEITPTRSQSHGVKTKESKLVNALPKIIIVGVLVIVLVCIWVFLQKMTSGESSNADNSDNGVVIKQGANIGNGKVAKKEDSQEDEQTDSEDKKDTDQDQASDETKTEDHDQQLKLDSSSGNVSHYTLSGTNKFDLDIAAVDGKNSWIQVSKDDPKGERLFYSMVSNGVNGAQDAEFHQDLSDADTIYIKVGNTTNTTMKINDQPFEFPDNGTVQEIYITLKKSES